MGSPCRHEDRAFIAHPKEYNAQLQVKILPTDFVLLQDRAVQILAEYLLDINASRQSQSDATDEYRANLEANVSDAIATLPKLTTGVDINVRFNGVRNVEFTQETAVFDILDVPLVHGWLVDPQDPAAVVLGTRSYNDVVMRIIATLGESGTPKVTSRRSIEPFRSSSMRGSSSRSRQGALYETGTTNITCESSGIRQRITGEMLNEALKASMSAAGAIDRRNETLESGSGAMMKTPETAKNASLKEDGMDSAINTMLSQVVKEAFKTPEGLITSKGTEKIERGVERGEDGEEERGSMKTDQRKLCGLDDSSSRKSIDDASTRRTILNDGLNPIDDSCCGQISKSPGEGASKFEQQDNLVGDSTSGATTDQEPRGLSSGKIVSRGDEHSGSSRLLRDVAMSTGISPNKDTGEGAAMQCDTAHVSLQAKTKDELSEVTREALLMREFLDANISQLTFHGLASLLEDVPDRSLSVFFRNNHFNALLRYDNALFILVTDQGYLYEPDVVWEYLCDVGGDTQLVGWNLKPFRPHAGNATESLETAELVNEASGNNKEFEVRV